jgi:flagellar biosynthesis GTPase FlhF
MDSLATTFWLEEDAIATILVSRNQRRGIAEYAANKDAALAAQYSDEADTLSRWSFDRATWPSTELHDAADDDIQPVWVAAAKAKKKAEKEAKKAERAAEKRKAKEEEAKAKVVEEESVARELEMMEKPKARPKATYKGEFGLAMDYSRS